jgi:ABC-2 type transport system permease protein
MCTIFGSGQMRHLPIGVVDADNTATSRHIVRSIAAVPTFDLTAHYADEAEARQAVQRKAIYGYLSIPPHFEADRLCGRDATLCYYYHYALLAVGGEVMSGFEQALIPVRMAPIVDEAVALGSDEWEITQFLLPLTAADHALYNPSLDYSVYLSLPIYYIMFQILVLLVTLYAIGCEARDGTSAAWLASARGNILVALTGKLLPYTLLFIIEALLANAVFFGHFPTSTRGAHTSSVFTVICGLIHSPCLSFTCSAKDTCISPSAGIVQVVVPSPESPAFREISTAHVSLRKLRIPTV